MRDNPVSEDKLQEAAREYLLWELQKFDAYADYPEPEFHGGYKLQMAALRHDVKRGAIKEAEYRMGATFYIKRSIAAILLVFTMACLTMPETVLAGYQKLIEVVEIIIEEYTEYRYRVNDVGGIEKEFKPLKLEYLPEGMEIVEERQNGNSFTLLCMDNEKRKFLKIYQRFILGQNSIIYITDTEDSIIKEMSIFDKKIRLVIEEDKTKFVCIDGGYYVTGQTNLLEEEIIKIFEKINIKK